jgi:hypothetical protein
MHGGLMHGSPRRGCANRRRRPRPANTEQVPHVPGYAPRTLLSIFTPSPSRTLRIISANHLKTGRPWVPPSVAIRNYRSILHTQHKDADPTAFQRMFLQDVAQKARNRPSELKIRDLGESLISPQDARAQSAACGWHQRGAYPARRSCGRVAEGGGLLNLIAPYPPVPFGLTVYEFVDVFPFSRFIVSRLNTLGTYQFGGNCGGKKKARARRA